MDTHRMPRGAVVVGYDASATSEVALAWGAKEAGAAGRPLHLVHTVLFSDGLGTPLDLDLEHDEVVIAGAERAQRLVSGLEVTSETRPGGAAARLVELSSHADVVVVGGHGHHLGRSVLVGATAPQVAAHSRCPVVVVHDDQQTSQDANPGGQVTVGVDGSESSTGAVEFAFARASRLGLGLAAVGCWWWQESGTYMAGTEEFGWDSSIRDRELRQISEQLAGWCEKYPDVEVTTSLAHGSPVDVLVEQAHRSELLVLGTRGRGGFAGLLLGSVSLRVLTAARRPVAIVPSAASGRGH